MYEDALWLCAALALVFLINLVPAFMPSSWMVLAFFYIKFGLPLLALTVGGSILSGLGRLALARASLILKRRFLKGKESDLDELGGFLNDHRNYVGLTVFLYTLSPLPTNNLFIAAGMVEVNMARVLLGFWAGRIPANTLLVWTTDKVFSHGLKSLFEGAYGDWVAIALQLASLGSIVLLYMLPWGRWLRRYMERLGARRQKSGSEGLSDNGSGCGRRP
jgi:hypothetical protein